MTRVNTSWPRERLIAAARFASERAYAPYSRFRVGAVVVVETAQGPRAVSGANVENASYGLTLCAERAALAAACSLAVAERDAQTGRPRVSFVAIACVDAPDDAPVEQRVPCGACRQWLAELAPDAVYVFDGVEGEWRLKDLLPHAFAPGDRAPAP